MREILFRGKSILADTPDTLGYWLEGNFVESYYAYHIVSIEGTSLDLNEDSEVWPETIGQFTGFIDKNGKKIFEGDIVRYKKAYRFSEPDEIYNAEEVNVCIRDVKYKNGKFSPVPYCDICEDYWYSEGAFDFEVIGNIYDEAK